MPGLQNLLNPADENDVVGHATLQELGREVYVCPVSGCLDIRDNERVYVEHGNIVDEDVYRVEKQVACLKIAKATLERHGALGNDFCNAFHQFQRNLMLDSQCSMKQISILDHFMRKKRLFANSCHRYTPTTCIRKGPPKEHADKGVHYILLCTEKYSETQPTGIRKTSL